MKKISEITSAVSGKSVFVVVIYDSSTVIATLATAAAEAIIIIIIINRRSGITRGNIASLLYMRWQWFYVCMYIVAEHKQVLGHISWACSPPVSGVRGPPATLEHGPPLCAFFPTAAMHVYE